MTRVRPPRFLAGDPALDRAAASSARASADAAPAAFKTWLVAAFLTKRYALKLSKPWKQLLEQHAAAATRPVRRGARGTRQSAEAPKRRQATTDRALKNVYKRVANHVQSVTPGRVGLDYVAALAGTIRNPSAPQARETIMTLLGSCIDVVACPPSCVSARALPPPALLLRGCEPYLWATALCGPQHGSHAVGKSSEVQEASGTSGGATAATRSALDGTTGRSRSHRQRSPVDRASRNAQRCLAVAMASAGVPERNHRACAVNYAKHLTEALTENADLMRNVGTAVDVDADAFNLGLEALADVVTARQLAAGTFEVLITEAVVRTVGKRDNDVVQSSPTGACNTDSCCCGRHLGSEGVQCNPGPHLCTAMCGLVGGR